MTNRRLCTATTRNGKRCRAAASGELDTCTFHSASSAVLVAAGRAAGGKARAAKVAAADADLSTIAAQIAALENLINRVRAGHEPLGTAKVVLAAIAAARPLVELGDIERRLEALEQR